MMRQENRTYIFGPVPSRRLGRSLGVDIVPFKTCTYDCIYCQLGRTTNLTVQKADYVPVKDVLDELWMRLDEDESAPDYITLSGSGEPTLNNKIGMLIESIRTRTNIPVAVLTNGSLLWDPEVQKALMGANLVVPSLDAGDSETFKHVNRPHPCVKFEQMMEGLVKFAHIYRGTIWLEVFFLQGFNSTTADALKIKRYVDAIQPHLIQLNTVVRPAAEAFAVRVSEDEMEHIRQIFGEGAEVIVPYERLAFGAEKERQTEELLAMLKRRPCTIEDLANGLGMHRNEVVKHLTKLRELGQVRSTEKNGLVYYDTRDAQHI